MSTMRFVGFLVFVGVLAAGGCAGPRPSQPSAPQSDVWRPRFSPGLVHVTLRDSVQVDDFLPSLAAFPAVRVRSSGCYEYCWLVLDVPDGQEEILVERLQANPYVLYAGLDTVMDLR